MPHTQSALGFHFLVPVPSVARGILPTQGPVYDASVRCGMMDPESMNMSEGMGCVLRPEIVYFLHGMWCYVRKRKLSLCCKGLQ